MKEFKKILHKIKNDNFWKNLFKNSFWAFFGDASASVITFIISIILIKIIGNESYGILILAQSYMNIMDVIINIQSWRSTIQYGQKALVDGNDEELHSYVKLGCIMDISTAILCFIILEIFTIVITILYYNNNYIGNLVNKIFSLRLYYNVQFFEHFGITPFGVNFNGFSNSIMTLDMAYSNILIRYGIFFTIFMCIIFKKLLKYLYENKNYILMVIFLIFIINGLFENVWLRIERNIFMLIFYQVVQQYIKDKNLGKQKEDERVQENFTQN